VIYLRAYGKPIATRRNDPRVTAETVGMSLEKIDAIIDALATMSGIEDASATHVRARSAWETAASRPTNGVGQRLRSPCHFGRRLEPQFRDHSQDALTVMPYGTSRRDATRTGHQVVD
jgi:hypothetical protein